MTSSKQTHVPNLTEDEIGHRFFPNEGNGSSYFTKSTPEKQAMMLNLRIPFLEIPFVLPKVHLEDPTALIRRESVRPHQNLLTPRPVFEHNDYHSTDNGGMDFNEVGNENDISLREIQQEKMALVIRSTASPSSSSSSSSSSLLFEPGTGGFLELQEQEEQRRQMQHQIKRNKHRHRKMKQKNEAQLIAKVNAGVAKVLCAIPISRNEKNYNADNSVYDLLDDRVVKKYSKMRTPFEAKMHIKAKKQRLQKTAAMVGNSSSKARIFEHLTLVPASAMLPLNQKVQQHNGREGKEKETLQDLMAKPESAIQLMQHWKEEMNDLLNPTSASSQYTSPTRRKKLQKMLPNVDLKSATLSQQQQVQSQLHNNFPAPSLSGPLSRNASDMTNRLLHRERKTEEFHVRNPFGDRVDDESELFNGNSLSVEVQSQLNTQVHQNLGTGMWHDIVGSTIAKPLTVMALTEGSKQSFRFTDKAHTAAIRIGNTFRIYSQRRHAAATKLQNSLRRCGPMRRLAQSLFLRFHASRRMQFLIKARFARKVKIVTKVQAIRRMFIKRRRLLSVVRLQRMVRVVQRRTAASFIITNILRLRVTRKHLLRIHSVKKMQRTWRDHKYRIPILLQAHFRGFVKRMAFIRKRKQMLEAERDRRIHEDTYVVENRHLSAKKALEFVDSPDGILLTNALWQRFDAQYKDGLDVIAKLPTESERKNEHIRTEFDSFDIDGSSSIDITELDFLLKELAIYLEPDEVQKLMNRLDKNNSKSIDFEEYKAWRWDFDQFKNDFNIKNVFLTGAQGFQQGIGAGMRLLAKQVRRWQQKQELEKMRKEKDKQGALGRRLARCYIVRNFIKFDKRNLRQQFRTLASRNQPRYTCFKCLAPFFSELRLQWHQALYCNRVDPNRYLPGEPTPAGTFVKATRHFLGIEDDPDNHEGNHSCETIAELHPKILDASSIIAGLRKRKQFSQRDKTRAILKAETLASQRAITYFKNSRWGQLQVTKLAAARRPARLFYERKFFSPPPATASASAREQQKRKIKKYEAMLMFKRFDVDASGTLDIDELALVMNGLGMDLEPDDLQQVRRQIDTDGSGAIDMEEFCAWYVRARVIGRTQDERTRMWFTKLKSDVISFWNRNITFEVDTTLARYDLIANARAVAGEKASLLYRQSCPQSNNRLQPKVDPKEYGDSTNYVAYPGAPQHEDGWIDFDAESIISSVTTGTPLPEYILELSRDAQFDAGDWEEVERRKEENFRMTEANLSPDERRRRFEKREAARVKTREKRRIAAEAEIKKQVKLMREAQDRHQKEQRADALWRSIQMAATKARSASVAPESVSSKLTTLVDDEDANAEIPNNVHGKENINNTTSVLSINAKKMHVKSLESGNDEIRKQDHESPCQNREEHTERTQNEVEKKGQQLDQGKNKMETRVEDLTHAKKDVVSQLSPKSSPNDELHVDPSTSKFLEHEDNSERKIETNRIQPDYESGISKTDNVISKKVALDETKGDDAVLGNDDDGSGDGGELDVLQEAERLLGTVSYF